MCNHKVPALLPFKTVKGINDYVGFKEDGTMEVGAGMEVDGNMTLNSPADLKFKQGSLPTGKMYYQHTITISYQYRGIGAGTDALYVCFTALSTNNLPCDSWQDIFTVFGGRSLSCSGALGSEAEKPVTLDLHTATTSGAYFVYASSNSDSGWSTRNVKISEIPSGYPLTIKDDVCLP